MGAPESGRRGENGQDAHQFEAGEQTDQDIRQQNAALIAEVARLTEAVEARDAFLTAAAHELRNPMTPIASRIQILGRAVRRPDVQVDRLAQSIDQIEWLITRYLKRATILLEVSRITSGKLRPDRLPVDVCEVAHEVIEYFLPLAQHSGSDLTLDLLPRHHQYSWVGHRSAGRRFRRRLHRPGLARRWQNDIDQPDLLPPCGGRRHRAVLSHCWPKTTRVARWFRINFASAFGRSDWNPKVILSLRTTPNTR